MTDLNNSVLPHFDISDQDDICQRFDKWIKKLKRLFSIKNIDNNGKMVDYLFFYGGDGLEEIYDLYKADGDDLNAIIKKIRDHFNLPRTFG